MITLIHPEKNILISQFNLKHKEIETGYTSILTIQSPTNIDELFIGDTIQFYQDNELILESNIIALKDGLIVSSAEFSLASGDVSSDKVIFYNATNIRVALDLNIKPGIDFNTDTHDVTIANVTHYGEYSEILI